MRAIHRRNQRLRTDRPTDLPTGNAECFSQTADRQRALRHSRQGRQPDVHRVIVENVFIDLIGDRDNAVLLTQRGDPI